MKVIITQIRPKQKASPPPAMSGMDERRQERNYELSPIKISEKFETEALDRSMEGKESNVSFEKCEINYPDLLFEQDIGPGKLLH